MTALVGTTVAGYQVLRRLGRGGMGEVYLARDVRLCRLVALKVVHAGPPDAQSRQRVRRFREEIHHVAALSHPHILPIYTDGYTRIGETWLWYLVMPYCAGGALSQLLAHAPDRCVFPPRSAVALIGQVADALTEAHRHGIMHLDIKAANLLLRHPVEHTERPDLLLADFGIACLYGQTNREPALWGTPQSMAPEQWQGAPEVASDQYALAVLAYQLLTGCVPFVGNVEQLCFQHLSRMPLAPSQLHPALPPQVDAVLLQALAKTPAERFASVQHFAQALSEIVSPGESTVGSTVPSVAALQPLTNDRMPLDAAATTITCSAPISAQMPITTLQDERGAQTMEDLVPTQPATPRPSTRDQARGCQRDAVRSASPDRGEEPDLSLLKPSRLPETGWFAGAGSVLFVVGGAFFLHALPVAESVGLWLLTLLGIFGIGGGIWLDWRIERRSRRDRHWRPDARQPSSPSIHHAPSSHR